MRVSVASVVVCLALVGLSGADESQASIRKHINIPAEGLGPALQTLAKDGNFQIVYVSEEINALRTPGLVGDLTSDEALKQLLNGTGLTFRYLDANTVTVMSIVSVAPPADAQGAPKKTTNENPTETAKPSADAADPTKSVWSRLRLAQVDQGTPRNEGAVSKPGEQTKKIDELEEVVVTAEYRREKLNDVPAAISALTGSQLQDLGANSLSDFAALVPGLTLSSSEPGANTLILRGINTGGQEVTSLVGVTVDGVPFGSSSSFANGGLVSIDSSLWDMDRVEVLRGPQGTLYGANAMTGLISYVYRSPVLGRFEVNSEAGVSSTEHGGTNYAIRGTINLPVADTLALRVSGSHEEDQGFIDNSLLGLTGINKTRSDNGRVALLFQPNDALSVKLEGIYQHTVNDASDGVLYSLATHAPVAGSLDAPLGLLNPSDFDVEIGALTVDYAFGPATLTSITSYQDDKATISFDYTGTGLGTALQSLGAAHTGLDLPVSTEKVSEELHLASRDEGALRYLAGIFYTHETSTNNQYLDGYLSDGSSNPALSPAISLSIPSTYREYAFFGQLTYALTPSLDLSAGIRYSHDSQTFSQTSGGPLGSLLPPVPESSANQGQESYLFSAKYALTGESNLYARASSGYRPGGPNVSSPGSGAPSTFSPDKLWNYEGGYKATWLGGRASLQADAFYIDWKDIQLLSSTASGFSFRANGGRASSRGLEAQGTIMPAHGLTIGANFAYTEARLNDAAPQVGGLEGEQLPYSPRWSGAVFGEYRFPIAAGLDGFAGTTVRAMGERTTSFNGSTTVPQFVLNSYVLGDVRAGIAKGSWTLAAYVHNVADRRAEYSALTAYFLVPNQALVNIAQPRTVGLTIDFHL